MALQHLPPTPPSDPIPVESLWVPGNSDSRGTSSYCTEPLHDPYFLLPKPLKAKEPSALPSLSLPPPPPGNPRCIQNRRTVLKSRGQRTEGLFLGTWGAENLSLRQVPGSASHQQLW